MFKKLASLSVAAMLLFVAACGSDSVEGSETSAEMVKVTVQNGQEEMIEIEVPKNPQRIVVLDYVGLDMIDSWGLGDNVVGMSKSSVIPHLADYHNNEEIVNLGGLKEINMEALMSLEPDVIFTSGRTAARYDEFSKIAPTVMSSIDYESGFMESFEWIARRNASVFGMEEQVEAQLAAFDTRIEALQDVAKGQTAIIGIMSGGSLNTLGNNARGSIIGQTIGFENLANDMDETHGNVSSFELLLDLNPDHIFVLDRDSAIQTEGASTAEQLMDNEIVHQTDAYKNGNITYLTPGNVWYMAEGGITAMDLMLANLEESLLN